MPTIVISCAAPHDIAATEMEKLKKKKRNIKYKWQRTEISYYWHYFTKAEDSA